MTNEQTMPCIDCERPEDMADSPDGRCGPCRERWEAGVERCDGCDRQTDGAALAPVEIPGVNGVAYLCGACRVRVGAMGGEQRN